MHRKEYDPNVQALPILVYLSTKAVPMEKNTSISIGSHFEQFINDEIKSGRYGPVSEVIRTTLCLLESEERKLNELRNVLIVGEQSGFVEDFDSKKHLKALI